MKNKLILVAAQILVSLVINVFAQNQKCLNPVPVTNDPVYYDPKFSNMVGFVPTHTLDSAFAYCAWSITKGDPDIIVAVIDSEFDTTHEDMKNTFENVIGTRRHSKNHGTGVSSLVASGTNNGKGIAGIGYNTRVRGYHAAENYNPGDTDCVWNQIKKAYQDGIKIINVSWNGLSGYDNYSDRSYLEQMLNDGVVLVLAADNKINALAHREYADIPGAINVSCVDKKNCHGTTNTARNSWVDVCATSSHIITATNSSDTAALNSNSANCVGNAITGWYCITAASDRQTFTSDAAPQVAGTVALMRSVNSFLSSAQIENIIKTTGDPINDSTLFEGRTINNPPPRRVNAYKAVKKAKELACGTTNTFSKTINTNNLNESVNGGNVIISNTTVASGRRLSVRACNSVTITGPFFVDAGAVLNINVVP